MPINNDSTLQETFLPFLLKSICRKLWCLSAYKNSTASLNTFLRYCKDIVNLLYWELWKCLAILIKNHNINLLETFMLFFINKINFITHFFLTIVSVWWNVWCLSARRKLTLPLTVFLRYCKNIANLLFWIFWVSLATYT